MTLPRAFVLLGALFLVACSSPDSDVASRTTEAYQLVKQQVALRRGGNAPAVNTATLLTRDILKDVKDSMIRTRTDKTGAVSLLFVSQASGGAQIWFSPDNVSVTMRSGVITQTRGVGADLYSADAPQMIAVVEGRGQPGLAQRLHRRLDGSNAIVKTVYDCTISNQGPAEVVVLDRAYRTTHFREDCTSGADSFTNDYWVDASRIVRTSRQRISPEFGYISTERLID